MRAPAGQEFADNPCHGALRWAHRLVHPEPGCLVLAKEGRFTRRQQYFYRAAILVIQHGREGTVGLILNRPTTFTMGDVCRGDVQKLPGMEDNVSARPGLSHGRSREPAPRCFGI